MRSLFLLFSFVTAIFAKHFPGKQNEIMAATNQESQRVHANNLIEPNVTYDIEESLKLHKYLYKTLRLQYVFAKGLQKHLDQIPELTFRFEDEDESRCKNFAESAKNSVKLLILPEYESRLMGPSEALLSRSHGKYRFDLYFKSPNVELLFKVSRQIKMLSGQAEVDVMVDVDPYNS